jgi:hypothetical protein
MDGITVTGWHSIGLAPLELLHDEPVGHVVQAGAAVLLREVRLQDTQLGQARDQLLGEAPVYVRPADHRHERVLDPGPHGIADHALLLGEECVDVVEVDAFEARHESGRVAGWRGRSGP